MKLGERLRQGLARTRERLSAGLGRGSSSSGPNWERVEEALIGADLGPAASSDLIEAARASPGRELREVLREKILAILKGAACLDGAVASPESGNRPPRPEVLLVVGVNGAGKTTTVAKLAARSVRQGRKPLIVAADTFRAAALEQIETWARRVGADLVKGQPGADPAAVVHDGLQAALARGVDEVLIDTGGRMHTKLPLMEELAKVTRVAGRLIPGAPHQTLLVMDATVGGNGLSQASHFAKALGVSGMVLTKLDGTARGGIVVAVARELGIPVRFAGVGEGVEDLVPFSPEDFVEALLGERVGD